MSSKRPYGGGSGSGSRGSSPQRQRHRSPEQADARTKELPLRLWADAGGHARALCGQRGEKSFVLGVHAQTWRGSGPVPSVALVLGCGSVACVVCDAEEPPSAAALGELLGLSPQDPLPGVLLLRARDDRPLWHALGASPRRVSLDEACDLARGRHLVNVGAPFARCIVSNIRSYYFRQVQEPSVKGFLSLLENAIFPRNDLYLFELLQNAVDDEALTVRFEARGSALRIWHDGREFSPLDVFGLSSVGFSAKSGRTIGFMGVGFKAVYKRYSRVRVRDRTWAFRFEEPAPDQAARRSDGAAANGWVLMPEWDGDAARGGERIEQGCEFLLELPRGGRAAVSSDLAVLPHTLPPLLGRSAMIGPRERASGAADAPLAPFSLQWGARRLTVQLQDESKTAIGDGNISGKAQELLVAEDSGRSQRWVFISRSFRQDSRAVEAFAQHTRKVYPDDQHEEITAFFEIDERGKPRSLLSSGLRSSMSASNDGADRYPQAAGALVVRRRPLAPRLRARNAPDKVERADGLAPAVVVAAEHRPAGRAGAERQRLELRPAVAAAARVRAPAALGRRHAFRRAELLQVALHCPAADEPLRTRPAYH